MFNRKNVNTYSIYSFYWVVWFWSNYGNLKANEPGEIVWQTSFIDIYLIFQQQTPNSARQYDQTPQIPSPKSIKYLNSFKENFRAPQCLSYVLSISRSRRTAVEVSLLNLHNLLTWKKKIREQKCHFFGKSDYCRVTYFMLLKFLILTFHSLTIT